MDSAFWRRDAALVKLPSAWVGCGSYTTDDLSFMLNRPIISATIRAKDRDTRDSLQSMLTDLVRRLRDIWITASASEHQLILGAMSESDLEAVSRILRAGRFNVDIGDPRVVYVETIRENAEAEGKYIRQTGGQGNYAHLKLRLEPQEWGSGYLFVNEVNDDVIPTNYRTAIHAAIEDARLSGILAGREMVDFKAVLYGGSHHETDSNEAAFNIAASTAFKEAARKANPVLIEPMMALEVTTSQDYVDLILRDLSRRRSQIQIAEHGLIRAIAPLAELLGYEKDLQAMSDQLAECTMRFSHYAELADGEQPGDETGITANKPTGPKPKHGSIANPQPE